ncbi:pyrroline-5-carboxylate reductase [Aliidiomarina halalkaliphila]|uniref:Pyrroline-5-carboxylate reductase n=1 Tax=Aliidiomarina halalkaliphila TaxID=2593535 RepID=A0A552WYT1_9GAMM|nr:pyrroline-5-carboxylate reductase [Aliidiomarina halalkaliphila]TRW47947.1 pyrroline-5-carboxylate reductase [Aliidiomarina halalkaliphila]
MTSSNVRTIGFIGAGNMPQSILGGMVKGGYPTTAIMASNPSRPKLDMLEEKYGIYTSQDNHEIAGKADVIVLSVKPQLMRDVCADLAAHVPDLDEKLIITIAAGLRFERYYEYLGNNITLVRVMPNTPSLVGEGVSGLVADDKATQADRDFVTQVFNYVGLTLWLDNEDAIDVLGAVAGSGPAYFFEFMHGLQRAAEDLGFDAEQARAMVQQTAFGAARMAMESDLSLVDLRKQVTSKGGSTAKGIEVYQNAQLSDISKRAVGAAVTRNQEMAKLF